MENLAENPANALFSDTFFGQDFVEDLMGRKNRMIMGHSWLKDLPIFSPGLENWGSCESPKSQRDSVSIGVSRRV